MHACNIYVYMYTCVYNNNNNYYYYRLLLSREWMYEDAWKQTRIGSIKEEVL